MKTQDQFLLEEAYRLISEGKKKTKPDYLDVDKDGDKKESMKKAFKDKENKKTKEVDESSLEAAYQKILESKYINKGFARRYNKVTNALLKAEPGSEEYQKLKAERDDLVSILKDHGKTPAEIQDLLVKKEKTTEYSPNTDNQYGDNTYSDTADLANIVQGDFSDQQTQEIPSTDVAVSQ